MRLKIKMRVRGGVEVEWREKGREGEKEGVGKR